MSVEVTLVDGIGRVLINRPDVRNALNVETLQAVSAGFAQLQDEGAKAGVLAGRSGAFSSGADLVLVKQAFAAEDPATVLAPLVDTLHSLIKEMRQLPFPVIAAVEGPAVGAGMGLALAADVRVVAASAIFLPGYMAIGASPDGGTSYFLTRSLGGARAASLYLRGKPLTSETLAAVGLADEIVDDGEALSAAEGVAQELAGTPPLALVRMRALIDRATTQSLNAHLDEERHLVAELWPTHDFREGVGAFLERRKPTFEGH